MSDNDPIASATLARLYMSQGHWVRAMAILDEVLARAPLDGDALALRARFNPARPRLQATSNDDRLCLRWQGVTDPARCHVVLCLWGHDDGSPCPRVTSRRCTGAFGRHVLPQPWARGVLVASLGFIDPRGGTHGYVPLAVAEPLGWG